MPCSALVWPLGIWGEAQTLYQNVNSCSNDILNHNECYSNWLMGNSHPIHKGERSKQYPLISSAQVFLTGPWFLPIVDRSHSVFSVIIHMYNLTNRYNNYCTVWSEMQSGCIICDLTKGTDILDISLIGLQLKIFIFLVNHLLINFTTNNWVFSP